MSRRTKQDPRCGTNAGYQAHRRAGEPICDTCAACHSLARTARWRENPDVRRRQLMGQRARNTALRELAREYPERFSDLYERAKAEQFARARANGGGPS